jgi:thioredoxin family protein
MKVRTSINAVITLTSMSAIIFSVNLLNPRAFGQDSGSPNGQTHTQKPSWLDGSGKDLRVKITGEVYDENGTPAKGYKLQARLRTNFGRRDLPAVIEGNRFRFWVPVGSTGWFRLCLNATSAEGRRIATETIITHELRQAAIDGLKLTMKQSERSVDVTVVENGEIVSDAFVAAGLTSGVPVTGKTNDLGVATFGLMSRDKLSQLTAWTNDFRIGGYSFHRDPPRDPMGDKHTIELDRCRSQAIRIINDEDKSPVPNLDFILRFGTGPPNYQSPGKPTDYETRTDENGEAVYRWFSDWEKHNFRVQILDQRWIKVADDEMVDGTIVVRVRKSQFENRKRVAGLVKSANGNVAGFFVSIRSFQGENKNQSDVLYAFTDENGKFAADYLPGATYCIYVNDARFVSNIIDLIPYEPTIDKTNAPSLKISAGQPVEVVVTSGPEKRPIAHQGINLTTPHDYSWREDGKTRNGSGGRRWWVTTDEQGKAYTFALPGKEIEGSIYSPEWRSNESVQVKTVGVTRLEFHQKVATKRKIVGRLLLAADVEADLNEAVVQVGSIDGETKDRLTLKANPDGEFDFESKASRIGIYARTKDSKAAAVSILDRLDEPIELQLKPTGEFRGQLLGREDRPLAGHAVRASLHVSGKPDYSKPFPTSFSAATFESKTDSEGNYSLTGLPCEVRLNLRADSIDGSDRDRYLDEFYLVSNESRPRAISRLWKPKRKSSFADRYEKTLRDCRLSNFHAMVILFRPSDDTKQFVDANLLDYDKTKEVSTFMQLTEKVGDESASPDIAEFGHSKNWPIPDKEKVFACAMDPTGKELGRIELDSKAPEGPKLAAQFIRKYAPKPVDARKKWDKAFAIAKQTNRKVWIRISQRYCGPCFRMARWLDDQKEILEQDYVLLKIDDVRDLHGHEVAKRLTGGENFGVPFHAIFDPDAKMLINSEAPIGNIGHPSGFEGKKHLRKMLTETRSKLTGEQIDDIVASLND